MLVLSRTDKLRDIIIGEPPNQITVSVVEIDRGKVRLGITAPKHIPIHRSEVYAAIHGQKPEPSKESA